MLLLRARARAPCPCGSSLAPIARFSTYVRVTLLRKIGLSIIVEINIVKCVECESNTKKVELVFGKIKIWIISNITMIFMLSRMESVHTRIWGPLPSFPPFSTALLFTGTPLASHPSMLRR